MSYQIRLEDRNNGEVRVIDFESREQRAVFNFDVHKYRYSYADPELPEEEV